jgi:hypothetical protein
MQPRFIIWDLIEGKISKIEAFLDLSNLKNSKSPGSDGFTAEFHNFFKI